MALKSTIYKAELQIADMDRHYYADHALTVARHPSETDDRMMVRIVAFALFAHERLEFSKGLSDVDEPDLWQKDLTGAIDVWIEAGQPDERRISKAAGRAGQVTVIAYGGKTYPVNGQIVSAGVEQVKAADNNDATKVAGGAVVGAILGHILGGRSKTKGTIIGAAAGAATGAAASKMSQKYESCLPAGSPMRITLNQPIVMS